MTQVWDSVNRKFINETETEIEKEKKIIATMTTRQDANFKLIVPRHIWDKISWWMHKTDKEVSGFGSLDWDKEKNTFTVRDAILLKQEVGPASTEIEPAAMARAMYRMRAEPNGLKWHWHSHVNMGVFWSADDMELIRSLGQQGWILATVFNYAEEHKTAYYTTAKINAPGEPLSHDIFINDIPTSVINYISEDLYKPWDAEYLENVTEEKAYIYSGYTEHDFPRGNIHDATLLPGLAEQENDTPKYNVDAITDYDEHGYGKAPAFQSGFKKGMIYNPCFDQSLKTDEERFEMIEELSLDEMDFLETHSPSFATLLKAYMVREANWADVPRTGKRDFYEGYTNEKA